MASEEPNPRIDRATAEAMVQGVPSAVEFAALRAATREQIAREETSRLARIRALPTATRRGALLGALGLVGALALVTGLGDRVVILTFLAIAAASLWTALRPIHQAPAPRWLVWGLPFVALATAGGAATLAPQGAVPLAHHIGCFLPGLGLALVLIGITRILSRRPLGSVPFAAAVGAGLGANAFLAGRCPLEPDMLHLLVGHGSVLAVLLALAAGAGVIRPQTSS